MIRAIGAIVLGVLLLSGCDVLMPELKELGERGMPPEPEPVINETNETIVVVEPEPIPNVTIINLTNQTIIPELNMVCFRQCVDRDIRKCMANTTLKKDGEFYIFNSSLNWTELDLENDCTFNMVGNRTEHCTEVCLE